MVAGYSLTYIRYERRYPRETGPPILGPPRPDTASVIGTTDRGTITLGILGCSSDLGTFCQYYHLIEYYANLVTEHIIVGKQVEH